MEDRIYKYLYFNQSLKDNFNIFMEAFIKYYGEEFRDEIEEKFSNIVLVPYQKPDSTKLILQKVEESISSQLIDELLSKHTTSLKRNDLFNDKTLEFSNLLPLSEFMEVYDAYLLGADGRLNKFLTDGYRQMSSYINGLTFEEFREMTSKKIILDKYQDISSWKKDNLKFYSSIRQGEVDYRKKIEKVLPLLQKIDSDVTTHNFDLKVKDNTFSELINLLPDYMEMLNKYKEYKTKYSSFYEEIDRLMNVKYQINNDYYKKLIFDNINLIREDKRKGLDEYKNDSSKSFMLDNYITDLFGYSLNSTSLIEYFSEDNEEKLNSSETSSWIKDDIIKYRIKYFNINGINLGSEYQLYLNNSDVLNIWPNKDLVNNFISNKKRLLKESENEYYLNVSSYNNTKSEIDSLNLLDKNYLFSPELYELNKVYINPNIINKNGTYNLLNLLVVSFNNYDSNSMDHDIVHELNHIFELSLDSVVGNTYSCLCGWDGMSEEFNQDKREEITYDGERRKYELFNEIINEVIAQEICEEMHNDKIHVFDDPNKAKYQHTTSYEHSLFLVRDFFKEYKDIIIKSRRNGNINLIFDEVGKENFDALNNLFKIFDENFNGFKIYNLLGSLKKGERNKDTMLYHSLISQRDEILMKMRNYSSCKFDNYNNVY